jgi:hypothetical protein
MQNFLGSGLKNRATWHYANDLGYFNKPSHHRSSSNQTFYHQNNDSSDSTSQQKRQKRGDDFRERKNSSQPIEICWTCGIKGHSRAQCNKSAHPDRNQENVPFLQSTMGKRWASKFPTRPVCD